MEVKALKDIQADPNIILKEADKGGDIVIMNVADYDKEVLRQLQHIQLCASLKKTLAYDSVIYWGFKLTQDWL